MHNASRWAKSVAVSALQLGALYAWKVAGIDQSGNLLAFFVWVLFVLSLPLFLAPKKRYPATRHPRVRGIKTFSIQADAVLIAGLAWFGEFALAGAFLFAVVAAWSFEGAYDDAGALKREEPANG